jgi:hypothetical protein
MRLQGIPIKLHAVTGQVWSDHRALCDGGWVEDETLKSEAVNFQVGWIGHSRQKLQVQLVDAMSSDGQVAEFIDAVQVLAASDRQPALAGDAGMTLDIVRDGWFFKPIDVKGLKAAHRPDGGPGSWA